MKSRPVNLQASVTARLRNIARNKGIDFEFVLRRYAIERLLYRLSLSPYRDRFVLKGAMLFTAWTGDPFRPTRDVDLLGFGESDAVRAQAFILFSKTGSFSEEEIALERTLNGEMAAARDPAAGDEVEPYFSTSGGKTGWAESDTPSR